MKKIVPDPPILQIDHCLDRELARIHQSLAHRSDNPAFLDTLTPTRAHPVSPHSLFSIRPGISAEETLVQVSLLLKGAEDLCEEFVERGSDGIRHSLMDVLAHCVEMARGLVESLLKNKHPSPD